MTGLPEGISLMDATIMRAYAANGEVSKFREVANTLPSTPAVLSWVSACLKESASPESAAPQQARRSTSDKDATRSRSRKRRASTTITVHTPKVTKREPYYRVSSSPDPIDAVGTPESGSPEPHYNFYASPSPRSVMDTPPRRYLSIVPSEVSSDSKRVAFLTAIIKGLAIATVRGCVLSATKHTDVVDVFGEDKDEMLWYSLRLHCEAQMKKMKHAAVRKICLDAALAHPDVEENVLVETPSHIIEKCLDDDEVEEMGEHFLRRAKFLLRKRGNTGKYSRMDSLPKVARGIAEEIESMLDTLLKRSSSTSLSSESKKACLSTTTILVAACLAPCPPYNYLYPYIKNDHAVKWNTRVRDVMKNLTDKELLQMRNAGYDDQLLRLWKHVRRYTTRVGMVDRWAIVRYKELGQRPPPEPKIWPEFEKKTMRYFAARTGGWNKAWDPVKTINCFDYEIWV
ncbi:hypothetical protein A1Q1_02543 [Trichosporon asahii var. asahii CBS 2479]|uniref:Uncharacterized protein n=1 Tax=Trichosporon asahii var. asahii (strain ATCC 90039 / CBS 2479 / JCM 2466 / KCTC 7840 / NBRC 103889/ NCYC 2677 / UAMH 7654) TaxID=1186058 RepID=J5SZU2_TRIAS|nr:hypothetical protein A1Q1_02543 [Trichosporon asahii var. asahii CBS 2479]EJT48411.1 hypothetical protein A1Q1_02543 [Trichosporon asahii var. asahii CBS 2479]